MTFKFIPLILSVFLIGLSSCNSNEGNIETVIEKDSPDAIVHTEWKPEKKQMFKKETTAKKQIRKEKREPAKITNKATQITPSKGKFHLQLGAFVNLKNAENLIKKVETMGFHPFMEESEFKRKKWYFVRIGPYIYKNSAVKAAKILTRNLKTDVIVLKNKNLLERVKAAPQPAKKSEVVPKITTASTASNKPKISSKKSNKDATKTNLKKPVVKKLPKKTRPIPDPNADSSKKPYSFQIGGLHSLEIAKKQLRKYQLRGYSPYLVAVPDETTNEKWYSVRIGKFKTLKDAVDEATIFSKQEQIPTMPHPLNY